VIVPELEGHSGNDALVVISFSETRRCRKGLNQANNRAERPQSRFQRLYIAILTKQHAPAHCHCEISSLGSSIVPKDWSGLAVPEPFLRN
jgi:hypothetical protein